MIKIEFIKAFGNKAKGDTGEYRTTLANRLIQQGHAKIYTEKKVKAETKE